MFYSNTCKFPSFNGPGFEIVMGTLKKFDGLMNPYCPLIDLRAYGKTCLISGHSKIDKTKILMTNGSLIKVESIARCSPLSILLYF